MPLLKDKVVIVTGAAGGIGAATVRLLASEGAKVVVASLPEESDTPVVAEVQAAGGEALFIATDVRDPEQSEACIRQTVERFGRVDVLYNAAGATTKGGTWAEPEDSFDNAVRTSTYGTYHMCKAVIPHMEAQGGGVIVNTSSQAAVQGMLPDHHPIRGMGLSHHTAKAAIEGYTRALAVEIGNLGIRVNCVAPGWVETPRTMRDPERAESVTKPWELSRQAIKRITQPEDIASTVLFLASDMSRQITGQVIRVDAGVTLT